MDAEQIVRNLETEIRSHWGWELEDWVKTKARKVIIKIYAEAAETTPNGTSDLLANNLYYAMESYIYFSDSRSNQFLIKDLLVFLERIIKNQTNLT